MFKTIQAEFLFSKGQRHANKGNWNKSIDFFNRAISLKPNDAGIYLSKALSLSNQNKISDALSVIENAISLEPKNHAHYLYKGRIYYDSGNYDNALNSFEKSLSLSSHNSLLKCYSALTLLRKSENDKKAYETLLYDIKNTNPDFQARFLVFCEAFLLQNKKSAMSLEDTTFHEMYHKETESQSMFLPLIIYKLNRAFNYLSSMFNAKKRNYCLNYLNAELKLNERDVFKAIEGYKKALSYLYEFNAAFEQLLRIYFYQKKYESIMNCFTKLKEFNKVIKLLFDKAAAQNGKDRIINELKNHVPLVVAFGQYYYHCGEYKKAINIFRIAVLNFSDNYYFNYHLGLSYLGANDQKNALSYFHKAVQKLNPNVAKIRLEEMIRVSTNL